jgi:hypothetical protein
MVAGRFLEATEGTRKTTYCFVAIVGNGFLLRKCKDTSHSARGAHGWVNLRPLGMVVKL